MQGSHILIELVVVLGTAAVVTVLFQALRLPVVLGYVLAGLVIGPHVPVPLVANPELVHVLSELGVILLMFTVGLELPIAAITRVGLAGAFTAVFEVGLVVAVGTLVARAVGFDAQTAVFAGACLGISSTMLVARAFDDLGWKGGFTEIVFAVLVFEDLIAIVLLAVVTAVASGAGLDAAALALLLAKLAGFLVAMLVGGLLVVPRAIRWIAARAREETLLITALLVCFGGAALAELAGYSVALGAFLAGVLVAESGRGHAVLELVAKFRDVFAMVFFVSVGMSIDPSLLAAEGWRIAVFALVVIAIKPLGVALGVFFAGNGIRPALRAGLSLAQIGEFSFVIAGVVGSPRLLAIAVGVSCATTLTSPLLIRRSEAIAAWLAGRLPGRVATFVSFYEGWLARRRTAGASGPGRWWRRSVLVILVDAAALVAIVIAGSTLGADALAELGVPPSAIAPVQVGAIAALSVPFLLQVIRRVALLARRFAQEIIPAPRDDVDLGRAARRALVITFELAIALAIVVPLVAIVQPFVPASFAALLVVAVVLVLAMRRRIRDFDGHVRASSALILELLAQPAPAPMAQVHAMLPGFDQTTTLAIADGDAAVGRSLAALDLRARTGATVLAIARGDAGLATPSPTEPLRAGDRLAVAGSDDAIAAARALLAGSA